VAARQVLLASLSLLVALVLLPGSGSAADEHILVQASGLDDGTTTHDSIRITGTSAANVIRID